jgi:hypothetical protein
MSGTSPTIPEFSLNIGERQNGNAAAIFAGQIFLIGAGKNSDIYQTLYALEAGLTSDNLTDHSLWQNSTVQLPSQFTPQTSNLCAAVVLGGAAPAMYLAWNQPNTGILAAPCAGVTSSGGSSAGTPQWGNGLLLRDQSGNVPTARSGGSDVCATSLGSQAFLLAYPVEQGGQPAVFIGLYYVADQTTTMISTKAGSFAAWNARASVVISLADFAGMQGNSPGFDMYDTGSTVSIVTIPSVAAGGDGASSQLTRNLVGFMTVEMDKYEAGNSGPKTSKFWWPAQFMLPLDASGAPSLSGSPAPQMIWTAGMRPKSNLTAICDPAGRIVSCSASQDWPTENLQVLTFGVFQTYTMPPSLAPDGMMTQAPSAASPQPPALLFLLGAGTVTTPANTTNATGNGDMVTTVYSVMLLAFYGATTVAQMVDFGTAEITTNYAWGSPLTQSGSGTVVSLALTGIIDGPIPLPNQNIAGWQFESTTNDLGSIAYGTQTGASSQSQQSWNIAAGIQTEGSISLWSGAGDEKASMGIAWDASISGGYSQVWGSSSAANLIQTLSQSAVVDVDKSTGSSDTTQTGIGIIPYGSLWGAYSGMSINNFRFVDAGGTVISDGSQSNSSYTPLAAVQASLAPLFPSANQFDYVPYMVTPGNLLSYTIDGTLADGTACGINATMNRLTGGAIPNYFETIIWPGAYTFMSGTPNAQKYLKFAWGLNGVTGQGFNYVTGSFNNSSWQVDASAYVGFTWGSSGGIPLIAGYSTQGSIMAGVSGGYSASSTTTTTDQWGVQISPAPGSSPSFGPPSWGNSPSKLDPSLQAVWDAAIASYGFALFLLPDPGPDSPAPLTPGCWVRELIAYGNTNATTYSPHAWLPAEIDPTVGCWKIVYVVLYIQTNADLDNDPPTYTYCYTDPHGWFGGSFCVAEAMQGGSV